MAKKKANNANVAKVKVELTFTKQRISSLLTGAFEGGSNTWYQVDRKIRPEKWEFESEPKCDPGKHYLQDYVLNPGGALYISSMLEEEKDAIRLDWERVQKGLQIMAEKYPSTFVLIVEENDDAATADTFLQCCIFGEEVYC